MLIYVPTIMAFNIEVFTAKCTHCSALYDASFCDFYVLSRDLFKVNEDWVSRQLLHLVVIRFSSLHGWIVQLRNNYIQCNRFVKSASHLMPDKQINHYTFRITISALVKYRLIPKNTQATPPKSNRNGMVQLLFTLMFMNTVERVSVILVVILCRAL